MDAVTDVMLITGFLGSGKTTFLNRLTRAFPPERRLMILMNEFGDVGIDGLLVEGEDLEILEISRGSIFCACVKTDFIKGLLKISRDIRPDVLIVEATGAADPGDMRRDLSLSVFQGRFRFREQICLIDAENFTAVYETFASVEKQMAAATCFIINKIDVAGPGAVQEIREIIRRHHPDPIIHETTYGGIPLERLTGAIRSPEPDDPLPDLSTDADMEAEMERLMKDPFRALLPPDSLSSAVCELEDTTPNTFKAFADALPGDLVRAKGLIRLDGEIHLFSWVMGKGEIRKFTPRSVPETVLGRLVCIGPPDAVRRLSALCEASPFIRQAAPRKTAG